MLGAREPYHDVPQLFSDLFHHRLDYVGCADKRDGLVMRRYAEDRFIAFYTLGGEVKGAALVNDGAEFRLCRDLMKHQGRSHDLDALSDPDVALATYLSSLGAPD
jgi:3-phenylpropionate/trans-cinnamate dioxygenase ferredoxin reductase subunit